MAILIVQIEIEVPDERLGDRHARADWEAAANAKLFSACSTLAGRAISLKVVRKQLGDF